MSDVKVYKPTTIKDTPFPNTDEVGLETSQEKGVTYSPSTIKDQPFPTSNISSDVISRALNTKSRNILGEFTFTPSGALQIGKYEEGKTGDIKISPDGIVATNSDGETTFALDGDTGDAIFLGTILAGSVIATTISADLISAGTLTSVYISADYITAGTLEIAVDVGEGAGGAYVRLDGANNRIIVHDGTNPRIVIGNV